MKRAALWVEIFLLFILPLLEHLSLLAIDGIIVDPVSEDGKTPFFVAVNYAQTKILCMLHVAGADIFAPDGNGLQPINIAANFGKLETVKTLIELGADVDQIGGWEYMAMLILWSTW